MTDQPKVTERDREAALRFADALKVHAEGREEVCPACQKVLSQMFARHREEAVEKCAKVLDGQCWGGGCPKSEAPISGQGLCPPCYGALTLRSRGEGGE